MERKHQILIIIIVVISEILVLILFDLAYTAMILQEEGAVDVFSDTRVSEDYSTIISYNTIDTKNVGIFAKRVDVFIELKDEVRNIAYNFEFSFTVGNRKSILLTLHLKNEHTDALKDGMKVYLESRGTARVSILGILIPFSFEIPDLETATLYP